MRVTSTVIHSVTCGAVNAESTIAWAIILRTPLIGLRCSRSPERAKAGAWYAAAAPAAAGCAALPGHLRPSGRVGLDVGAGDDAALARPGHAGAGRRRGPWRACGPAAWPGHATPPARGRRRRWPGAAGAVGAGAATGGRGRPPGRPGAASGCGAGPAGPALGLGLLDAVADEDGGPTGRRGAADLALLDLLLGRGGRSGHLRRRAPLDAGLDRAGGRRLLHGGGCSARGVDGDDRRADLDRLALGDEQLRSPCRRTATAARPATWRSRSRRRCR